MNRAAGKRAGSTGAIPISPNTTPTAWSFGLNICTELWAVETYAAYAARGVQVILSPRATAAATTAKWLSVGVVAAVRSGAFSLSSNRVDPTGACGGVGWIIDPYGNILARTTLDAPFATVDIDLSASAAARDDYPCYVFSGRRHSRLMDRDASASRGEIRNHGADPSDATRVPAAGPQEP